MSLCFRKWRTNAGNRAGPIQHRDFLALRNQRKDCAKIIVNLPDGDAFHVQHDVPHSPPSQAWDSDKSRHHFQKTESSIPKLYLSGLSLGSLNSDLSFDLYDIIDEPRGNDVSPSLRWFPVVTMLQLAIDMAVGTAPEGFGHTIAATDYIEAWLALTEPPGWDEAELARLRAFLKASDELNE